MLYPAKKKTPQILESIGEGNIVDYGSFVFTVSFAV